MAKAVFTTAAGSIYDDLPEYRYHFPKTYLRPVEEAVGDWIVYYEPRRTGGPQSSSGRQAYFAVARVTRIESDRNRPNHFYAHLSDYLELDRAVPFCEGAHYYESKLRKEDGSTSKGAFGRAVRSLPDEEYQGILHAGFARELEAWETDMQVAEPVPEYEDRLILDQIIKRSFRDAAFRRHVRVAYNNRCAISGLKLINGGGRPEVQAAHIRPVAANGPDSIRNGLALTGTLHWLFDRGLVAVDDDYRVLLSGQGVPKDIERLIRPDRELLLPDRGDLLPHPAFLRWHRERIFKT